MNIKQEVIENGGYVCPFSASYEQAPDLAAYMRETGGGADALDFYAIRGYAEAMSDRGQQFHFSNGIFLPSATSKNIGRLSLRGIAEASANAEAFADAVDREICARLNFDLSDADRDSLIKHYAVWQASLTAI